MASPTNRAEAFVYCWTDMKTNKLYVGAHKGNTDDGYISSSKILNEQHAVRPSDFSRQILAHGSFIEMRKFETAILRSANAAKSSDFYNRSNSDGSFFCVGHTEDTKSKMSNTWKNKGFFNCSNELAISAWKGSKHTIASRAKMSEAQSKHSETRSNLMKDKNPMKDPALVAKMLETRRKNKEAKNGNA